MGDSIRPCCYPGCRDGNGDPRLTGDVICGPSRAHYRNVLDWLAVDYVTVHTTMPKPVSSGPRVRSGGTKTYGHPAEWASDTLREIADVLNAVEDNLREVLDHAPAVHPGHREQRRVALAHRYLCDWFDDLCVFDGAGDVAVELNDLHRKIRGALGQTARVSHLPTPCPNCRLLLLVRLVDASEDYVSCRNPDCGAIIPASQYGLWTQILVEDLIETGTCA